MRWADAFLFYGGAILVVSAAFSNALIEVATVLLVAAFLVRSGLSPTTGRAPAFTLLVAVWLLACLISALVSSDLPFGLRTFFRKTLPYALLGLAAVQMGTSEQRTTRILSFLAWSGLLVSLDALLQGFLGHDVLRFRPLSGDRLTGPFTNPNTLASYLLMVIPIQLLTVLRPLSRWQRVALMFGIGTEALVLMQTDARASWLTLIVALVIFALLTRRVSLLACLVLIGGVGLWRWGVLEVITRVTHLDPGRVEGWSVAWRMFRDHPIAGIGLGTYMANYMEYVPSLVGNWPRPQYAHNCYLQVLAEGGVIGLSSWLLLLAWVGATSVRSLRAVSAVPDALLAGLLAALAAFLINMAFDTGFYSLPMASLFWYLLGLTAGVTRSLVGGGRSR